MKRAGIALAVLAGLFMTGCSVDVDKEAEQVEEVTITYRERDLHCLSRYYDRSLVMVCDFERFYAENPETATLNTESAPLNNKKGNK